MNSEQQFKLKELQHKKQQATQVFQAVAATSQQLKTKIDEAKTNTKRKYFERKIKSNNESLVTVLQQLNSIDKLIKKYSDEQTTDQ